ncbi:MAG: right-handed parallel beta-helix repeat-containing protein [Bacteroidales bacterium]|nr:right-handed parallel beta-helix repeat-containing protein [Bacteroidales bacterium]
MTRVLVSLLTSLFCGCLMATDIYTTPDRPLYEALVEARELHRLGDTSTVTIHLSEGNYPLEQTLVLRPEDSRTRLVGEGDVTISGGIELNNWKKEGRLWVCDVPEFHGRPLEFRQLYINGKKATRCKDVSDWDDMTRVLSQDRTDKVLYVPVTPILQKLAKADIGHAEMILHEMWCVSVLRISSIRQTGDSMAIRFHQPEADIQFSHPWPSPLCHDRPKGWNASPFYITNHKALLDRPGEWFLDLKQQKVYYYPRKDLQAGIDETRRLGKVIVPVTETLVAVEGTLDRPAEDISFENIRFEYSTWLRPSLQGHVPLQAGMPLTEAYKLKPKMERTDNHKLDNQGWLERPAAAVSVKGGRQISFSHCRFTHLGSSGLDYVWGTEGGRICNCQFSDIAGNGIVAGTFSPTGLETHLAYNPADTREVVNGLTIEGNRITGIGTEDWGCVAIAAGCVSNIDIAGNEISEVPYTGISMGWSWNRQENCMHHNRVRNNHIFRFAKHMYDCAAIYTLGNQRDTEITGNRIHDICTPPYAHDPDHWFWLYTDEGSSNIHVHDNDCPSDKFLQNACGPGNVWENNVNPKPTESSTR